MDQRGYPHPQPPPSYDYNMQYGQQPPPVMYVHQPPQVIVDQPQVHVIMPPQVGPDPTMITCPSCRGTVVTRLEYEATAKTHIIAGLLCLFGCWLCVWMPYCSACGSNANHYCPACGTFVGTYSS